MSRELLMSILTIVAMAVGGVSYINSLERRIAVLELQLAENTKDDAAVSGYVDRLWDVVKPPSKAENQPKPSG